MVNINVGILKEELKFIVILYDKLLELFYCKMITMNNLTNI